MRILWNFWSLFPSNSIPSLKRTLSQHWETTLFRPKTTSIRFNTLQSRLLLPGLFRESERHRASVSPLPPSRLTVSKSSVFGNAKCGHASILRRFQSLSHGWGWHVCKLVCVCVFARVTSGQWALTEEAIIDYRGQKIEQRGAFPKWRSINAENRHTHMNIDDLMQKEIKGRKDTKSSTNGCVTQLPWSSLNSV